MKRVLPLAFLSFILIGCGPSKSEYNALLTEKEELQKSYDSLEANYQELLEENANLELTISDIKTNPQRLEAEIEEHMAQNNHDSAYEKASVLLNDYPESLEAIRSKPLYEKLRAKKERKISVALSNLKTQKSSDGAVVWYYHKDLEAIYDFTAVFAYIVEKNGTFSLRVRTQQFAPNGATLEKIEIDMDNEIYPVDGKVTSKPFNGSLNLYIDNVVTDTTILERIITSGASINFHGSHGVVDLITPKEEQMLREVINSYKLLAHN